MIIKIYLVPLRVTIVVLLNDNQKILNHIVVVSNFTAQKHLPSLRLNVVVGYKSWKHTSMMVSGMDHLLPPPLPVFHGSGAAPWVGYFGLTAYLMCYCYDVTNICGSVRQCSMHHLVLPYRVTTPS